MKIPRSFSRKAVLLLFPAAVAACGEGTIPPPSFSEGPFEGYVLADREGFETKDGRLLILSGGADRLVVAIALSGGAEDGEEETVLRLSETAAPALGTPLVRGEETEEDAASAFHAFLRRSETHYASSPLVQSLRPIRTAVRPSESEHEDFRVLASIDSLSSFREVIADLRESTESLSVYVDREDADAVGDGDVLELAENFETISLPRLRDLFGDAPDVDGDGRVTVLMTCAVNRMSLSTSGAPRLVTGFFFPGDLYARNAYNPASNEREILYALAPDPDGRCGPAVSAAFAFRAILPGLLVHEFQHLANYARHVFDNRSKPEAPWLNEALSHLSEDLAGFGDENPARLKLFLEHPERNSVTSASVGLAERAASYAFLRYLYEQYPDGDAFLRRLADSSATGIENLEQAFSGTETDFDEFPDFLDRWAAALALTDTGLTDDPRLIYRSRTVDPDTGRWTGLCLRCESGDLRGTVLNGPHMASATTLPAFLPMHSGAAGFFDVAEPPAALLMTSDVPANLKGTLFRLRGK